MMLLRERFNFLESKMVLEGGGLGENGKPKSLYMKGIFIQGGVKNHNQRVYPVSEIRSAVEQINECFRRGESVLGEADHPEELNINLDRVSHMITELYMDGNNGVGKLKILNTPMGNLIRTMLEDGVKLGVSSRGSGNVTDNGEVSDFEMVTIDIVAKPSAGSAFPVPILETLSRRRGAIVEDLARSMQHDRKAQKFLSEELRDFINKLR